MRFIYDIIKCINKLNDDIGELFKNSKNKLKLKIICVIYYWMVGKIKFKSKKNELLINFYLIIQKIIKINPLFLQIFVEY